MVRATRYTLTLMLLFVLGCAANVPASKDEAFTHAVEAVRRDSYVKGARSAWHFIDAADPDDPRYDRGLRLLARSAEGMGLEWAAGMIYRQIASVRRNMELVPDSLRGLERIIQSGIYDEDTFITSFLAGEEFGDLPEDVRAFVDYMQGWDLARRGADKWAEVRFSKLPPDSIYAADAEFVRIVRMVADGDFPSAIARLERLRKAENISEKLAREVERTLARLAFEEERYEDALRHFETLKELAPDDPEILLEMAWTHFYLGDSRKTLGLLIALDAPVHQDFISPERFLLKALALRRLCQFGAARYAAVSLERRYGGSLHKLSAGDLPKDIPEMRTAARLRGLARKNTFFLDSLQHQMAILVSRREDLGKGLSDYLENLYTRGIEEGKRREEELIGRELEELTEELLSSQEGVRLIVHELGVSLLRGRRRPPGALEKPAVEVPITGDRVFYPFWGEYWTDEMDDLNVIAEDRCID
jgi:tetratricopeptide (TPR) repeat protein